MWELLVHLNYFAQLGCELLPKIRAICFTCLLGTSSKDNCLAWSNPRQNNKARELGAHDGSSPSTNGIATPPVEGTIQIWNVPPCEVNAIQRPSGDQSGSAGLGAPLVLKRRGDPPEGEIVNSSGAPKSREP